MLSTSEDAGFYSHNRDHSETGESDGTQDILTCGSCQKTFALSDIVRFIQHKVLQCSKENYGQCFTQAAGGGTDRDSDDGRRTLLTGGSGITTRRASMPNVSCRGTKQHHHLLHHHHQQQQQQQQQQSSSSNSTTFDRLHSPPPPTSPAELLRDGASSTPKRLGDEPENASTHCPSRGASPLGCSLDDGHHHHHHHHHHHLQHNHHHDQKPSVRAIEIKQERMDIDPSSSCGEEDFVTHRNTNTTTTTTTTAPGHRNGSLEGCPSPNAAEPTSEPSNYVCSTCKTKYHSAWRLVQHVQHAHGVKIYVESLASTGNQDGGAAPTEESDAPESAAASSDEPNGPAVTVLPEAPKVTDRTAAAETTTSSPRSRCASRGHEGDAMEREAIQSPPLAGKDPACNGLEKESVSSSAENGADAESDGEIELRTKRPKLADTSTTSSSSNGNHSEEAALALTTPPQPAPIIPTTPIISAAQSPSHPQRHHTPPSSTSSTTAAAAAAAATAAPSARSESTQSLPPPSLRAHHHTLLPPPELHPNPFALLRVPPHHHPHSPLFGRTHHDFRMEHLMSEQFRSHGLNLAAAAVAAANQLKSHSQQQFNPATGATASERPASGGAAAAAAAAAALTLTPGGPLEPHMDYYSQRLRQLAGTTSPGAAVVVGNLTSSNSSNSPSPRKQQHSPSQRFASPSPSQLPPTPLTNNSRPQSLTPPEKHTAEMMMGLDAGGSISNTPRSASTPPNKQSNQSASDSALYSCDFCGKKFRFQSNLLVHRRTHTAELPFKCTSCEFACAQAAKLKQHMKLMHGRRRSSAAAISEPDSGASNVDSIESDQDDTDHELMDADELDADGDERRDADDDQDDEEEDDDEDEDEDDEAEDLSMSSTQSQSKKDGSSMPMSTSLVGELMDKFGLSNIAQYSEAYKQALQESGNALKLQLTSKDRDNNNSAMAIPGLAEKLNGLPSALRIKEELAKNMLQHHNAQLPQVPLFNPFENPFEASKRMKLEGGDSWWGLPGLHRAGDASLFENLKPGRDGGGGRGSAAAGLLQPMMKKESKLRNDTCEFCGKVFKNCSNLTVHRRSHTGEKPYKCELCSYACAQSSKLTRHMKTHGRLGKDVYRCRRCSRRRSRRRRRPHKGRSGNSMTLPSLEWVRAAAQPDDVAHLLAAGRMDDDRARHAPRMP
uniref:C2H2-type domain-containing protein n=1 Tax=Anopheles farauti TaxID=69004 RepID=A0A182QPE2_9DIPT